MAYCLMPSELWRMISVFVVGRPTIWSRSNVKAWGRQIANMALVCKNLRLDIGDQAVNVSAIWALMNKYKIAQDRFEVQLEYVNTFHRYGRLAHHPPPYLNSILMNRSCIFCEGVCANEHVVCGCRCLMLGVA